MKEIILKVVTRKAIDFALSREQMIAFPTYYCRQVLFEEKIIIVEYKPAPNFSKFDEKGFIELVKLRYKKTLDAHSVEVVDRGNWGIIN